MEKLKQAAVNHWFKMTVIGFFTACTFLYSQQNEIIAGQGRLIEKSCDEMNKKIDQKVDNETLEKMIETINVKLDYDASRWDAQQKFNEKASETMKHLNESIIILNEKMKEK